MGPSYIRTKAGRPARTDIQQLCEDTGCSPADLPEAMNNREEWRERVRDIRASGMTWWWWWWWWCLNVISVYLCLNLICLNVISVYYRHTYYIHISKHIQADSVASDTNGILISDFGPLWHEERDTILNMLTPSQRTAHLVMFKISVGRDPKNSTTSFNG